MNLGYKNRSGGESYDPNQSALSPANASQSFFNQHQRLESSYENTSSGAPVSPNNERLNHLCNRL